MFAFYCAICCSKLSVWIPICEFSYLCPLHNFDMNVQIARGKDRRDTFLAQLWQGFHWMSAGFSLQLTTERKDGICRYFLCTEDHLKSQMSFWDLFFINWACISLLAFVVSLTYWSESLRKIAILLQYQNDLFQKVRKDPMLSWNISKSSMMKRICQIFKLWFCLRKTQHHLLTSSLSSMSLPSLMRFLLCFPVFRDLLLRYWLLFHNNFKPAFSCASASFPQGLAGLKF